MLFCYYGILSNSVLMLTKYKLMFYTDCKYYSCRCQYELTIKLCSFDLGIYKYCFVPYTVSYIVSYTLALEKYTTKK